MYLHIDDDSYVQPSSRITFTPQILPCGQWIVIKPEGSFLYPSGEPYLPPIRRTFYPPDLGITWLAKISVKPAFYRSVFARRRFATKWSL